MWKNKCKCGCGELCRMSYVRGHNSKGRKVTWGDKISETNKEKGIAPPDRYKFEKDNIPWNKELSYQPNNYDSRFKKGENKGDINNKWKGNDVGYWGLHSWVHREKGKPKICIKCGSSKKIQWANKSRDYKRDLEDWISLCYWCHRKYDKGFWSSIKRRFD